MQLSCAGAAGAILVILQRLSRLSSRLGLGNIFVVEEVAVSRAAGTIRNMAKEDEIWAQTALEVYEARGD